MVFPFNNLIRDEDAEATVGIHDGVGGLGNDDRGVRTSGVDSLLHLVSPSFCC